MTFEEKMEIVINNYFKDECSVNTSIREAFEKGFGIGVKKGQSTRPKITDEQAIEHLQKSGWMQSHDKQMYEMGLKERLADDSGSYDALLPSVQPEPIRINLNEPVKVKLTDWGKEIYYHQYDRTNRIAGREICKPRFPREDENGYTEFQLWCFIELYGAHMGMTLPNVIEPLEIVYERQTGGQNDTGNL